MPEINPELFRGKPGDEPGRTLRERELSYDLTMGFHVEVFPSESVVDRELWRRCGPGRRWSKVADDETQRCFVSIDVEPRASDD